MTLEERLTGQKQIKAIEAVRGKGRRAFFDAQDEIGRRREQLINEIERKLQQKVISEQPFATRWKVGWGGAQERFGLPIRRGLL